MRFSVIIYFVCCFILEVAVMAAELYPIEGNFVQGKLLQVNQNQITLQTTSGKQIFPADETIRVNLGNHSLPRPNEGLIVLANDDRIHAKLLRSEDETILIRLVSYPEVGELKVPLETIQAVYFQWPSMQQGRSQFIKKIARIEKKSDLFYLKNGDFLEGEFLGFNASTFRFESRAGETAIPRRGIRFFCFNPELINFPQPDQLHYQIELSDGTRLTASSLTIVKKMATIKTLFGAEIQIELNQLNSIVPLDGKVIYLSQLKPTAYEFTPFFSQQWGWSRNRNVLSGPLIVGGKEFAFGIGMHSAAELSYDLDGKYARFQTEVGIDDATNGAGDVKVAILVDRRIVFQKVIRGSKQQAVVVPHIDLTGAKELVLKVDFGKNADIQDHVNWCRPVLILKK
ncbi:NPCBM/NEW2 domain protein [Gimesia aquarii]|uniref:NPCBM/NEW2 domain protein n=2 Tax=Gimesia aquarii TaxID=2527964 RepID=A0A517WYX3_9PLAN|nr:NPCBM/NEW2 domain protein [Gimesia aquarii]